ncbi:hypothetical protein A5791_19895 [Mycobacterium sp. 852002-51163_SCH5372311]|uniref:phage major capsid family protein n=1 Tax=Mycobacterium sp. 852002-51163_SCH5372311 TaxID=1834097 RepID=UPI00080207DF|nr:phage major capsid protein [Mycobacterium sp. 852002-51163_SCH5372311]OBF86959.1 hypothetical protein A5791_19895 [Mycobacterium sp. 852002-51163_SCH5372311]
MSDLKDRISQQLDAARAIAEKATAEGRNFTGDEQKQVDGAIAAAKSYREAAAGDAQRREIMEQLDAMAGGQNSGGQQFLKFSKAWADRAAEKVMPVGQKALATGNSVFVDVELTPTPIPMGRPAGSLLDLLPAVQHQQPAFSYIRQSVRTNSAAVVTEGAVKPTSVYSIIKIDNTLSVVAHLSERVPRYWFEDAASLKPFMQEELSYGLRAAVEAKVLADINATSGIQTQAYSNSILETLRKSITKIEAAGYEPSAIVMHPLDFEAVELALVTTTAVQYRGLPFDAAARRLYGLPIAVANVQAQGTAHVLGSGTVGVDTDTLGVAIQWSETSDADSFSKNLVLARCEGRYATSVFQPFGLVKATLA